MPKEWLVIGAVVAGTCLPAQLAGAAEFGVKGGFARSSIAAGDTFSAGNGFQVGCFASIPTFKGFEIQPEVLFVRTATIGRIGDGAATIRSTIAVDFVEVPVLLTRTFHSRRVSPMVFGGAYGAIRTRAAASYEIGDASYQEDAKSQVRSWDFGLVVGAGLQVSWLRHTVIAEIRYTYGLTSINTEPAAETWRTRTIAVLAGIKW